MFWDRLEGDTSVFQSPGSGLWFMWETWQTCAELNSTPLLPADFLFGRSNFRREYSRTELCFMYVKCTLRAFMLVPRDTLRLVVLQNSVLLWFHI